METKICSRCGKELPLDQFYKDQRRKDGMMSECKECHKKGVSEARQRRKKNANPLEWATPRELMQELHRRGYEGTLEYTEVHKINIADF